MSPFIHPVSRKRENIIDRSPRCFREALQHGMSHSKIKKKGVTDWSEPSKAGTRLKCPRLPALFSPGKQITEYQGIC
ncbi:hypothetical protein [Salmonella enterica]|uniref:hypothetical protein n=1 Tax=Salmonella enterica TaxID=28901 RepID=UPI001C4431E9|nr:hypothetical protein [Salmonella enterica]